jgi:hypothetical protein
VPQFKTTPASNHCSPLQAAEANYRHTDERTRISNAERTERDAGSRRREAVDWHDQTLRSLLSHRADDRARLGLAALLSVLTAGYGLGWSDIARLVGVSVPAVRKWRHGGDITSVRFQSISRLVAFLDMLEEEKIHDPVTWLNLPLDDLDDSTQPQSMNKKDIYIAGGIIDLLEYAKKYISHEDLLARTSVRDSKGPSGTKLITAPDGHLSIVPNR